MRDGEGMGAGSGGEETDEGREKREWEAFESGARATQAAKPGPAATSLCAFGTRLSLGMERVVRKFELFPSPPGGLAGLGLGAGGAREDGPRQQQRRQRPACRGWA